MNQRGNNPMTLYTLRLPLELKESIEQSAKKANVSASEYIRVALEYIQENGLIFEKVSTFKQG